MSETFRITKTFVDKTEFVESGQKIYRDSDLIGFVLRVTAESKTYIVERRKYTKLVRIVVGNNFRFRIRITGDSNRTNREAGVMGWMSVKQTWDELDMVRKK